MHGLVSILIPVFNAEKTLAASIQSCLDQTYPNFELIVLNNGSTDEFEKVMQQFNDPRIRLISSSVNEGIAAARNKLLKEAKGEFIAWLDADDLMLKTRLEAQLEHFSKNPETDILGTWIETDNEDIPVKELPLHHDLISTCLWFKNCIVQPSVMSRNFYTAEDIFYDESYKNSVEDYELWYRLTDKKRFANLPQYLTRYHMTLGIDLDLKQRNNEFEGNIAKLWRSKWEAMFLNLHEDDKNTFRFFLYNNRTLTSRELNSISKTLKALRQKRNDRNFQLIIAFHTLRLWRNMNVMHKVLNLHLLVHLKDLPELKRQYLA